LLPENEEMEEGLGRTLAAAAVALFDVGTLSEHARPSL
jgi:hypothetical protein